MADLSLRIGIEALDRATAPLRRLRETTGQVGARAQEAAARVRGLETSSSNLAAFRRLQEEGTANAQAMARLDEELAEARRKLTEVDRATGGTGRAFQRARQHVEHLERQRERLNRTSERTRATEDRLRQTLSDAGVDTDRLAEEQQRLQSELEQANRAAAEQAERLERVRRRAAAFDRLRDSARAVVPALSAVTGRLSALASMTGLGGLIGGGLAGAGLGGMMQDFADSGREIDIWAGRLGMGTSALQGLVAVGGRFGVEQDAMIDGLKELSLRADEFAETGVGGGGEAFQRLGLSQADLAAVKGDTSALFELIRSKMETVQDVAARQRLADELFGGTGGEQMTEMLSASTEELIRMREEAQRMGAILSDEEIDRARSLSDSLRRLHGILGGVSKVIAARLAPVLEPLINRFGDWIIANKDLIATNVAGVVERLSDAVRSIDWGAVTAGLTRFRDLVTGAVERIGGWQNALIGVGVVMSAGLIGNVVSLGLAVGRLGISAAAIAGPALLGLARVAIPAVVKGLRLLRVAVMTNPITAIIGGIALAAGLIYTYWEPISAWFGRLWDGIKRIASDAWDRLKGLLGWDPLAALSGLWQPIGQAIGQILDAVPGIARKVWDGIKTILSWTPLGLVVRNWSGIKDAIGGALDAIPGIARKVWDGIKTILSWTPLGLVVGNWGGVKDAIGDALDAIPGIARKVWDGIKAALSWHPLALITRNWEPIVGWFGRMWDRITKVFQDAVDWIMEKIQPAIALAEKLGIFGDDEDEDEGSAAANDDTPRDARGRPILRTRPVFSGPEGGARPSVMPANDDAAPLRVIDTAPAVEAAQTVAAAQTTTIHQTRTYHIAVNGVGLNEDQVAALIRQQIEDLEDRMDTGPTSAAGAGGALYDGVM